jgi:N-methylhydantoinase A/oxoprolinase/acetone carboxylase beta subunit
VGIRVGIDIGGTFTDLFYVNEDTGEIGRAKSLSTPKNPTIGVMDAVRKSKLNPKIVTAFIHGTTIASNALVERKCPPVALICTKGFRDLLDMRLFQREFLFDTKWKKPKSLIPRKLRKEVEERINWKGEVLTPLNETDVKAAIDFFRAKGITSYAVCFIFSFLNADHEIKVRKLIEKLDPGAYISLSSEVLPEIREYQRMSTTVINAMVKPIMVDYIIDLEKRLKDYGIKAPLQIIKANGGTAPANIISKMAVETVESGPAGGVTAAQYFSQVTDSPNLIALDMGGTTTDVSIIYNMNPQYTMEYELEFGIPIRIPMMEIRSIGAGGGSVGWIDKGGAIRVGPMSSGADPGPACYGRGGEEPTVTDANLILGRLNPDYFLGGEMRIDRAASERVMRKVANHFNWDIVKAAEAIYEISKANMAQLIREMTVNRGFDPRDFKILSFGGGGSLYAGDIAQELGIPEVIIPLNAGVFSAVGCFIADTKFDYVQSYYSELDNIDIGKLKQLYHQMRRRATEDLEATVPNKFDLKYLIDLRYSGEAFEITVPLAIENIDTDLSVEGIENSVRLFHNEHKRLYTFDRAGEPIELVSLRLVAIGYTPKPTFKELQVQTGVLEASKGVRDVYFSIYKDFKKTPIYDRMKLGPHSSIKGPAVIEEIETSTIVFPGHTATVDMIGNIYIKIGAC